MYNFGVPSTLRAYFDHVARSGVTFRYDSSGAHGLLTGKRAYVIITRDGAYGPAEDTQTPYLRQFLSFVGIEQIEFIHAQGLALGPERRTQSVLAANAQIEQITRLPRESIAA